MSNLSQFLPTPVEIPIGGIIMWSGTIATIPTKWALCNGSNGTPDLRNTFIIGASEDSGGQTITSITGSNTKTGGSKDAVLVSHSHGLPRSTGTPGSGLLGASSTNNFNSQSSTEGESGTNKNLPPYYALAFIMRTE